MTIENPSDVIDRVSVTSATDSVASHGKLELLIASLFAEVFNLDRVGITDDFFDLGGDSLLAEVLSIRIGEQTGYEFRPSFLLEFGCPRAIAELLTKRLAERVIPPPGEGIRPPIFMVHGRPGFTLPGPSFMEALAEGQELRMFELPGIRGGQCYENVEDIAAVYVSQLSEEYPEGPIFLAGFCAGGLIALEMAAKLVKKGREVCHLVLLDPPIRQGTLGLGQTLRSSERGPQESYLKMQLRRRLPMRVLCRYHELKYRNNLLRERRKGSLLYAEFHFSVRAQAKLYAAFLRCEPRSYSGAVTIISSLDSSRASRGGSHLKTLLPQLRIQLLTASHDDVAVSAAAARIMQAVFDGAIERR